MVMFLPRPQRRIKWVCQILQKYYQKEYKGEKIGSAARLAEILISDYSVAVIPCADFGFDDHIRLSYATSIELIEKGLNRIEELLKSL